MLGPLLEFNHFVENIISTLVTMMAIEYVPEILQKEIQH